MKCNPWRWLWGLVPILMLGWIAILGERERIEADLTSRTRIVLERSGYGWADIKFDGRDAILSGRVIDESEPPKAVSAALDTMGVRIVENRAALIDKVDRYEWSAIRRDNRIRVDGLVPTDKTRRDIIGMVKASFPRLDVDDRMKLARGAPPVDVWLGGVGFGLKQLALLQEGRVDLEQTSLSVRGEALDVTSYRRIKTSLAGNFPQGIRLKEESVQPPVGSPFVWSARRQGPEVLVVGHVPNDKVRDELLRAARTSVPKAKIVDRTEPASGAPEGFSAAALALIEQLGVLEEGNAQIRDQSARLAGVADTADRAESVKLAMRRGSLLAYKAAGEIRHREPAVKTITPYVTAAQSLSDAVVLSGFVPDLKARTAIVSQARRQFAGRNIRDELQLGAGQPAGWERCMEVALHALQQLGTGRTTLTANRLDVSGTTEVDSLLQTLPADLRGRAGSNCEVEVRIAIDPAAIQVREEAKRRAEEAARQQAEADRQRREDTARLEADRRRAEDAARQEAEAERQRREETARLEAERRRAEEAARQQAGAERQRREETARLEAERRRAEDGTRQQAEAERQRREEAARLEAERRRAEDGARQQAEAERQRREEAARLETARLETERRRAEEAVRQRTEAERLQAAEQAQRAAADLARQTAANDPVQRERQQVVDTCQQALNAAANEGIINFQRASFDLDPRSYPTLNKLAEAANRCPALIVEIEGHTDAEGTPERNQRLSDRRANSVRNYLAKAGVDPNRLQAVGYGQDRNIASNDTPEGRAQNRRIEFVVKMQ